MIMIMMMASPWLETVLKSLHGNDCVQVRSSFRNEEVNCSHGNGTSAYHSTIRFIFLSVYSSERKCFIWSAPVRTQPMSVPHFGRNLHGTVHHRSCVNGERTAYLADWKRREVNIHSLFRSVPLLYAVAIFLTSSYDDSNMNNVLSCF